MKQAYAQKGEDRETIASCGVFGALDLEVVGPRRQFSRAELAHYMSSAIAAIMPFLLQETGETAGLLLDISY